jgi:hypothetical protein
VRRTHTIFQIKQYINVRKAVKQYDDIAHGKEFMTKNGGTRIFYLAKLALQDYIRLYFMKTAMYERGTCSQKRRTGFSSFEIERIFSADLNK